MSSSAKFCLSFVPGILAAASFLTTLFGGIYCRFLSFTSLDDVNGEPLTLYFGIWYYQGWLFGTDSEGNTVAMQTCYRYPDFMVFDAKWKSAKAFSTMAIIVGGLVTCWTLCAGCLYPTKKMYVAASMLYMMCCLFTGLSLLMLDSDACNNNMLVDLFQDDSGLVGLSFPDSCASAYGAKCIFSATVMWFAAAVGLLLVAPPERTNRVTTDARREEVKEDIKEAASEQVEEDIAAATAGENDEPTPMAVQQEA